MSGRTTPQVFLSDSSAEAGRLLSALQAKGFTVVDVPLGMLVNRCRYELPRLIICDADAREAEAKLGEVARETQQQLPIVLIGESGAAADRQPRLGELARRVLHRPIDLDEAVEVVGELCGPPARQTGGPRRLRTSRAPRLVTAARKPYRSDSLFDSDPAAVAPASEPSEPNWPVDSPPSLGPLASELIHGGPESSSSPHSSQPPRPSTTSANALSPETTSVLEEGRRRLEALPRRSPQPTRPSLEGVGPIELRQELVDALSEPLDESDVGIPRGSSSSGGTGTGTQGGGTSAATVAPAPSPDLERPSQNAVTHAGPGSSATSLRQPDVSLDSAPMGDVVPDSEDEKTNPGGKPPTQPPSGSPQARDDALSPSSELPPLDDLSDLLNSPWDDDAGRISQDLVVTTPPPPKKSGSMHLLGIDAPSLPASLAARAGQEQTSLEDHITPQAEAPSRWTPHASAGEERGESGSSLREGQPILVALAQAIQQRKTGAVAAQDRGGVRRAVMTDGDISTVISSLSDESLGHFLHERGDLSREILASLSGVPQFGRHAGAAFIARGLLGQEELWPVLRAHSEWILCRALDHGGRAVFEAQIPPRIAEEPAVFGGAAGAEIFLEAIRRTSSPDTALARLGGPDNMLSWGPHRNLMGESALSASDQQRVAEAMGKRAGEIYDNQPQLLPTLLALAVLGAVTPGGSGTLKTEPPPVNLRSHEMDTEAFIQRLRSRRALVDRGDYFAILGVARSASNYEVGRARDELLRELTEVQLGPAHQELKPDLDLVRATVDEAHLVLSDDVRRARYRRALDAVPKMS